MESNIFKSYVIGLDKASDRFKKFQINNSHLNADFYKGIDGSKISKKESINLGLISKNSNTHLTNGAIGCALSHKHLWDQIAKEDKGTLIMEDDVITHPKIVNFINNNYYEMMKFDITLFSINTDSVLESISPEGVHSATLYKERHPTIKFIKETLLKTNLAEVRIHKLLTSFGHAAYFVSPKGAKLLSSLIYPFKNKPINIPLVNNKYIPGTQDGEANRYYSSIKAIVCCPFLAYTPNIDSTTK